MFTDTGSFVTETRISAGRRLLHRIHLDLPLLVGLLLLAATGLAVLYSAGERSGELVLRQLTRMTLGFGVLLVLAQVRPVTLRRWAPWLYGVGLMLLLAVLVLGVVGKGAQRWLDLGLFTFQPSELMKLAVPMMIAWSLADNPLPPPRRRIAAASLFLLVPALLIAKQPDLGTALLVASAGFFVLFLAGLSWRFMGLLAVMLAVAALLLWFFPNPFLHDYQRQRILTFLHPENDPLGSGYHIIQSAIAIGSGGPYGKGWLNGTQSHLDFLPERSTDFIFSVFSEEFGFLGNLLLLAMYLFVIGRGALIAAEAQDTFSRLLAGSITFTFFVYIFVNIGMVSGLLPVVGLPLPLLSYGGTSLVTVMAGFGMLMSIRTHRRLIAT